MEKKKWGIIADSSCDYMPHALDDTDIVMDSVPFVISIGGRDYLDLEDLDTLAVCDAIESNADTGTTACPSPEAWAEKFRMAENIFAVTISSRLSGSYNSAIAAREMVLEEEPDKKIFVIDSKSAGTGLEFACEYVKEKIGEGLSFEAISMGVTECLENFRTIFALNSFHNLIKNGRMSRLAGFLAGKLKIWGIGAGDDGRIEVVGKARGKKNVVEFIINDMREHEYSGGCVYISHCHNPELAEAFAERVKSIWETAEFHIFKTRGLCSYYAERNGIIIGY